MLNLSGKKMSKSDGNIKLLNEYIDEFSGPILRFFFLKSQYRSPQEFNVNLLKESESTLNNLMVLHLGPTMLLAVTPRKFILWQSTKVLKTISICTRLRMNYLMGLGDLP